MRITCKVGKIRETTWSLYYYYHIWQNPWLCLWKQVLKIVIHASVKKVVIVIHYNSCCPNSGNMNENDMNPSRRVKVKVTTWITCNLYYHVDHSPYYTTVTNSWRCTLHPPSHQPWCRNIWFHDVNSWRQ